MFGQVIFGICRGHDNKQYPATLKLYYNEGDCFHVGKNCVQGNEATTSITLNF